MKLLNFMQDIVNIHKKCYKSFEDTKTYQNDVYCMMIDAGGIDIIRKSVPLEDGSLSAAYSVFTISDRNESITHKNNVLEFTTGTSSFFRASSGTETTVKDVHSNSSVLVIPRYNDNEDELLFTLSTVTSGAIPIVMASILLTLDTRLTTQYTYRITEKDVDEISDLLQKVKTWITPSTVTS